MDNRRVIKETIDKVDWEFVLWSCVRLEHKLKNIKLTKKELIDDLVSLLDSTLKNKRPQTVTNLWSIRVEYLDKDCMVEIAFTPLIIWVDTLEVKASTEDEVKIKDLQKKIDIFVEDEDYLRADKLAKSLNKYKEPKPYKNKIKTKKDKK